MELMGAPVAKVIAEACEKDIRGLAATGVVPKLAVIRIGERPDDLAYERGIGRRFACAGAAVDVVTLQSDVGQEALEQSVLRLGGDRSVHGILLLRPLPSPLSERRVGGIISPAKDVDGMSPRNTADVFTGMGGGFPPCTPAAVMELLDFYGIGLAGQKVTVIGRSAVVGRPLAMLLVAGNATVTLCHTKTANLAEECRRADILISCAGKAGLVTEFFVHPRQVVVDVGMNMVDGALCGDVDFDAVKDAVRAITPVPGGVGGVTTAVLFQHTVRSAMDVARGE